MSVFYRERKIWNMDIQHSKTAEKTKQEKAEYIRNSLKNFKTHNVIILKF